MLRALSSAMRCSINSSVIPRASLIPVIAQAFFLVNDTVIVAVPDVAVRTRFFSLCVVDPPHNMFGRTNELSKAGATKSQHHFAMHLITRLIGIRLLFLRGKIMQADADAKGRVNIVHHIIV